MINKYDNYLQELHNRGYTIYDNSEAEESALQELHDNSYLIFDEEETLKLMIEYEEEFDRLSHKVSFVSLQNMAEKSNIFEFKPKSVNNKSVAPKKESKHLFYINESEEVKAFGFFEPETKCFYICKGSTIEDRLKGFPEDSEYALNRKCLLDTCAEKQLFCWKLIKDAKCRTASIAATYVKGRIAEYVAWRDEKGLGLSDVYPEFFKKNVAEQPVNKNSIFEILAQYAVKSHLFYIKREFDVNDICDATGHYDPASKSFILHKDSILSLYVTSELRYSALDIQRRYFIKKHCIKKTHGYRLLHEISGLSPSQAAFYVLGCNVDGWVEWEDRNGKTLDKVYKKPI